MNVSKKLFFSVKHNNLTIYILYYVKKLTIFIIIIIIIIIVVVIIIIIIIELAHSKTILENSLKIKSQPAALDFDNL